MSDIEKRARELLVVELESAGDAESAAWFRSGGGDGCVPLRAIIAALTPHEGYVPESAMLRVATGLREKASRSARPLERKTLIASAEALEKAVSAARPEVQP